MVAMTGIVWLTQSLRFIDLIVIKGLPIEIFINLTILIIPKLLVTIIPFIGFLASLITYLRLNNDSEIISMKSAGIIISESPADIGKTLYNKLKGWFIIKYGKIDKCLRLKIIKFIKRPHF